MRKDPRFAIHLYEVLKVFVETSPRARLFFRRFAFFANLVIQYFSLSRHAQCINRGIVQSVERQSPKLNVEGSSPSAPVKRRRSVCQIFFFFAHLPGGGDAVRRRKGVICIEKVEEVFDELVSGD